MERDFSGETRVRKTGKGKEKKEKKKEKKKRKYEDTETRPSRMDSQWGGKKDDFKKQKDLSGLQDGALTQSETRVRHRRREDGRGRRVARQRRSAMENACKKCADIELQDKIKEVSFESEGLRREGGDGVELEARMTA